MSACVSESTTSEGQEESDGERDGDDVKGSSWLVEFEGQ